MNLELRNEGLENVYVLLEDFSSETENGEKVYKYKVLNLGYFNRCTYIGYRYKENLIKTYLTEEEIIEVLPEIENKAKYLLQLGNTSEKIVETINGIYEYKNKNKENN